jgi:hypothetical protein
MIMIVRYTFFILILLLGLHTDIFSQSNNCNPATSLDSSSYEGSAFFNYGTIAKSKSQKYQTAVAIGQNFVNFTENNSNSTYLGFYGRYLLPPFPLKVNATQGDLLDRIQITWTVDGLGPSPNEGFNIYRDGIFLSTVNANIRNYNDFNVIAGVAYTYSVRGINAYGEGAPSYALGFQVPNGVVTGWIRTKSGGPVPEAVVTLMPMQGFSAKFDTLDKAIAFPQAGSSFMATNSDWTLTYWMKTDTAFQNADLLSYSRMSLFIKTINSVSGNEGIEVYNSAMGSPIITAMFADSIKHDWNHISLAFENVTGLLKLYINGNLTGQSLFDDTIMPGEETFELGNNEVGGWAGNLDEVRIYNTLLNELDFPEIMFGTASSLTPGLTHYWKMDEELGEKSYDLKNRVKLFFCGTAFDTERPPVRTAGKTNSEGYYRIESASYGTGTTFLAEPAKSFYFQKSVKLTSSQNSNISIPNFGLPQKSTVELWVNNAGSSGIQTMLSKKSTTNDFKVFLEPSGIDQILKISLNGSTQTFGILGTGFQHLAITIDSSTNDVQVYKNGIPVGNHTFTGTMGNFAEGDSPWRLGVHDNGSTLSDYYNGLIDEFAVYDTLLTPVQINNHVQNTRNIQEKGLYVYFPMNEGAGNGITNVGSKFLNGGTLINCEWSSFAPNQVTEPHEFAPKTRQVTLNPSVTSVDQVDFIDNSTVPVSGFVRYKDTDCFANNVEILINNTRFSPPIFTDSTGRFVIDFDPGATAKLTPKFEDHVFVPAFWQVTNVNSPIAGIVFNDITTRQVSGIVAGGSNPTCKTSIMREPVGDPDNQGTVCLVQVRSVDGCFVRTITIDNVEGEFEFNNLPPLERMTVAVIEHSDDLIKTAFQVQGGSTVNLTKKDTIIDFIYIAPPIPEITSGLDTLEGCSPGVIVIDKGENITINIRLKEVYEGGACYLDTASLSIINGFSDTTLDTVMSGGNLLYTFRVGAPNISPPYLKTLQIIGTSDAGRKGSLVTQAIVTGTKAKLPSFTTKLPERPFLVLHDPPGDGSFAFLEKDSSFCFTTGITLSTDNSIGGGVTFNFLPTTDGSTGLGIEKDFEVKPILGGSIKIGTTFKWVSDSSFQTCVQTKQRISTDDGDLIVGGERGGDVFMGAAQNIIFGNVDEVTFDTCTVNVVESVEVSPGDFATTFIYSEFNIQNYVIPNLQKLLANPNTTPADSITQSIARWESILADNNARKSNANAIRNISYDAGSSFEFSETIQTSVSSVFALDTVIKLDNQFLGGLFVDDQGLVINVDASFSSTFSQKTETSSQYENTIGYVLKDDDPGDFFSIDIGIDSAYLTPTFNLRAGQSSCPWEPGSANREGPNLQLGIGTPFTAINVPSNESAVFKMFLGNESATNEDWTYGFTAIAGSNPDGAIIKLNGQPLNNNTIQYIVPYGTSIPITLTVDRGPIAYEYENLQVALVSECEMARNFALSLPLDNDEKFYSSINLGVDFIRPCSEVKINVPEQNWAVINDDPIQPGTKRRITVSGYDLSSTDFQLLRLQYRPSDGNGAWINIKDTFERYNPNWSGFAALPDPKPPTLQPAFTQFIWETAGLSDGNYEIHAWAVCSGDASDKPGFSDIIKGRIDREPPSLVGRPQPSDGVYNVGDEISFTFNKHINCQVLNPIDDVRLIDTETGDPININITCFENKIILDPLSQNEFFENKILRAELDSIQDLTGNILVAAQWEFYVDRNELAWLTDSISLTKYDDEYKTITAKIQNRGGYPVGYTIQSVPSWVHVHPITGILTPNEIDEIVFTMNDLVALGDYTDSIILHTETGLNPFFMGGDEVVNLAAHVICRPPSWVVSPENFDNAQFNFSMNIIVKLNIEGTLSADENDLVGAYVDGQLRGVARVEFKPGLGYMVFLTVYSNNVVGETIDFQIWDASACELYANILESFPFNDNEIIGTLGNPQILHTSGDILRKIYLHPGWNWISMNLNLSDSLINPALSSLSNPTNGSTIKTQGSFSQYTTSLNQWVGNLSDISPLKMYQFLGSNEDSLSITGTQLDANISIPVSSGWNWIGYLPNVKLPVGVALASLTPTNGDIIKSQLEFAVYDETLGWVGSLGFMKSPNGYLLKSTNNDTLSYPNINNFTDDNNLASRTLQNVDDKSRTDVDLLSESVSSGINWDVDPTKYEYNMNAIIIVANDQVPNVLKEGDEVGVFVNNDVRGSSKAMYIPSLQSYMIFLTAYSNKEDEIMHFKYYNKSEDKVYDVTEQIPFKNNSIRGLVDKPEILNISDIVSTGDYDVSDNKLSVNPNPFINSTHINFIADKQETILITIRDIYGNVTDKLTPEVRSGLNAIEWRPLASLSAGVYMISIKASDQTYVKKVIYIE